MVRAHLIPGAQSTKQYYCESCGEWKETDEFSRDTYYSVEGEGYIEVGGDCYYESYVLYDIWTCDNCDEAVSDPDQSPEARVVSHSWACGSCKTTYDNEDEAQECCT